MILPAMRPWIVAAFLVAACDGGAPKAADGANAAAFQARSSVHAEIAFPALSGRVVDQAGLLTTDEERRLSQASEALERRTTDQLVVVTVPSLQGRAIEDFTRALGNRWHIGHRGHDNGILLLVAPAERKVRIATGYGLEAILTNRQAAEIVDTDLVPAFRDGRWNDGISAGVESISAILVAHEGEPRRGSR